MESPRRGRALPARRAVAVAVALVAAALLLPFSASAQQEAAPGSVTGVVRDTGGVAVPYTAIYLVPEDTTQGWQAALTDSAGAFGFGAVRAAEFYLLLERAGHEAEWSELKRVGPGQQLRLGVTSAAAAVVLPREPLDTLCYLGRDIKPGSALGVLWREARKAAAARRLFDLGYSYEVRVSELLANPQNPYARRSRRQKYVSTPAVARELAARGAFAGYGVKLDSTRIVAVPELLQVLTESFGRNHCLARLPDRYAEHRLRFEPFTAVVDSRTTDFAGNIVLDQQLRLKRIEFEYRRGSISSSRGTIDFGDGPLRRGPLPFLKNINMLMFDAPVTTSEWLELDPKAYNTRARARGRVDVSYGRARPDEPTP